MIASHSRNFIFIRTRKTASTSTEIVLGSWCSPADIVTPVGPEDELTRLAYGGRPGNFCTDANVEARYLATLPSREVTKIKEAYRVVMRHLHFHHHMSAAELKPMLPDSFWQSAYKFAFDRHPYEKAVSIAYWRKKGAISAGAEVEEFFDEVIEQGDYRNFDLYTIDGKPAVDDVFRYEDLQQSLAAVARRVGATVPETMPLAKGQHRRDRRPAREVLSDDQKRRVRDVCREEFDLLSYEE